MKQFFIIIATLIVLACTNTARPDKVLDIPTDSKIVTTKLLDSLGTITFATPNRYDTFLTWTNISDCGKPCNREEYRYQPKSLPVFKESGFYYEMPDILKDQFTIIHSGYFPFHEVGDSVAGKRLVTGFTYSLKSRIHDDPRYVPIVFDTVEFVNDRYFSIIAIQGYDWHYSKYKKEVVAITSLKSNWIEFHYELLSKDSASASPIFMKNAFQFIRTIRISKGI